MERKKLNDDAYAHAAYTFQAISAYSDHSALVKRQCIRAQTDARRSQTPCRILIVRALAQLVSDKWLFSSWGNNSESMIYQQVQNAYLVWVFR